MATSNNPSRLVANKNLRNYLQNSNDWTVVEYNYAAVGPRSKPAKRHFFYYHKGQDDQQYFRSLKSVREFLEEMKFNDDNEERRNDQVITGTRMHEGRWLAQLAIFFGAKLFLADSSRTEARKHLLALKDLISSFKHQVHIYTAFPSWQLIYLLAVCYLRHPPTTRWGRLAAVEWRQTPQNFPSWVIITLHSHVLN